MASIPSAPFGYLTLTSAISTIGDPLADAGNTMGVTTFSSEGVVTALGRGWKRFAVLETSEERIRRSPMIPSGSISRTINRASP